ncbi:Pacrg [Symbiodinium natans]|uniref:Pacrg protein n=1 Tax=Symbiodinium natans TaxID=878477 RepID=A0A812JLD6_9DINO|nr:Pacrg [Symbiodinium natans]
MGLGQHDLSGLSGLSDLLPRPGPRRPPTSFYVDCRLYRPTQEEAEYARRSLAADEMLEVPSDPPPTPKAIPPKPKGLLGKGLAMAKDFAMQAVSEYFGSAGGKGDPDVERQCAELYGLFQRKNLMEARTDAMLRVNRGMPKSLANLEGDKAPGGLFIQHTASHQWYHCFILGKKEDAQLQCVAMEPDKKFAKYKVCGAQASPPWSFTGDFRHIFTIIRP